MAIEKPKTLSDLAEIGGEAAVRELLAQAIDLSNYSSFYDKDEALDALEKGPVSLTYNLEYEEIEQFHDAVLEKLDKMDLDALDLDPQRIYEALREAVFKDFDSFDQSASPLVLEDVASEVIQQADASLGRNLFGKTDMSGLSYRDIASELESQYGLTAHLDVDGALQAMSIRCEIAAGENREARKSLGEADSIIPAASTYLWSQAQGEEFDDFSDNFVDEHGNFQIPDDLQGSFIERFCEEQGTSFADVVNGANGPFAESMRESISECDSMFSHTVGVMARQDLYTFIEQLCAEEGNTDVARSMTIKAASDPNVYIYSPETGESGMHGIELVRDMTIKSNEIAAVVPEYDTHDSFTKGFRGHYGLNYSDERYNNPAAFPHPYDWADIEYGEKGDVRGGEETGESLDEMMSAKATEAEIGQEGQHDVIDVAVERGL